MGASYPKPDQRDWAIQYIAEHRLWTDVAIACNISPAAVRLWRQVPPLRVPAVEKAIGKPRRWIRPDLYE